MEAWIIPNDEFKIYFGERSGRIKDRKDIEVQKEAKTILTLLSKLICVDESHFLKRKRLGEKIKSPVLYWT